MSRNISPTVFFIRAYNDLDHFAPILCEYLKEGKVPIVILTTDLEFESDYRVKYLKSLGELKVIKDIDFEYLNITRKTGFLGKVHKRLYGIKRKRSGLLAKIRRRMFFDCSEEMDLLRSLGVEVCVFEWSTPFARGEKIEKYFIAAKSIGLTTAAIPHGCNIFINNDSHQGYRASFRRGEFVDQSETQFFDYYVLQNPIRREGWIKWGFNPAKTFAWGSVRFFPEWAELNKSICPKFTPPAVAEEKLKVVFMQFQKDYNVKNEEVMDTLKELCSFDEIALAVKDATREGKAFYDRHQSAGGLGQSLVGWYGNEVHSPALTDWADCVIVIGGSIGIEAMLQNTPLIYPTYLNTNHTMYEEFQCAHCVNSLEQMISVLVKIKAGEQEDTSAGVNRMYKEIIYGGKEEAFDVPKFYYEKLSQRRLPL